MNTNITTTNYLPPLQITTELPSKSSQSRHSHVKRAAKTKQITKRTLSQQTTSTAISDHANDSQSKSPVKIYRKISTGNTQLSALSDKTLSPLSIAESDHKERAQALLTILKGSGKGIHRSLLQKTSHMRDYIDNILPELLHLIDSMPAEKLENFQKNISAFINSLDPTYNWLGSQQLSELLDYTKKIEEIRSKQPLLAQLRAEFPLEQCSNWENFIIKHPLWDKSNLYNTSETHSQELYGRRMQQAINIGKICIEKHQYSVEDLLNLFADLRYEIATDLGHSQRNNFGRTRNGDLPTFLREEYQVLYDHFKEKGIEKIDLFGSIDSEQLLLSRIDLEQKVLKHVCSPDHFRKIRVHVENLYNQAKVSDDSAQIVELSGQIFWWICQAKPWYRGDPSIAELFIRSLWESKGLANRAWNSGTIPWVTVIQADDVISYGRNFSQLFNQSIENKIA